LDKKIKRIALAAALAGTLFANTAQFAFTKTASEFMTTLSSQVGGNEFAAGRATIQELQRMGVGAIRVGSEKFSLANLLAMIAAAEAGQMNPAALAAYLLALANSTAQAIFVSAQNPEQTVVDLRGSFPLGSEG